MRNLLVALFVVGLVAAPSMAVVVSVNAAGATFDGTKNTLFAKPGDVITVQVNAGSAGGVAAVCGWVSATGTAGMLTTTPDSLVFDAQFPGYTYTDPVNSDNDLDFSNMIGMAQANGAWGKNTLGYFFGTTRLDPARSPVHVGILPAMQNVLTYTVTVSPTAVAGQSVTLSFSNKGGAPIGYATADDTDFSTAVTTQSLTIAVPEPATMALLALGGLLVARRRRA